MRAAALIGSGDKVYLMEAARWLRVVSWVKHRDRNIKANGKSPQAFPSIRSLF